jgi:hypothetical protein
VNPRLALVLGLAACSLSCTANKQGTPGQKGALVFDLSGTWSCLFECDVQPVAVGTHFDLDVHGEAIGALDRATSSEATVFAVAPLPASACVAPPCDQTYAVSALHTGTALVSIAGPAGVVDQVSLTAVSESSIEIDVTRGGNSLAPGGSAGSPVWTLPAGAAASATYQVLGVDRRLLFGDAGVSWSTTDASVLALSVDLTGTLNLQAGSPGNAELVATTASSAYRFSFQVQ